MLRVWIDGACEPVNPGGTASYGLVVRFHQTNELLFRESKVVGSGQGMSNNVAEYAGLIAFLDWLEALDKNWIPAISYEPDNPSAFVFSDSQLLVNQMNGKWKVNKGLYIPYYNKVMTKIRSSPTLLVRLAFRWIPREANQEADDLSKQALLAIGIKCRH
jgi:ribonuclease HI